MKIFLQRVEGLNRALLLFFAVALFLAVLIAYNIVHTNPYIWLGILLLFLVLGISRSNQDAQALLQVQAAPPW